MTSATIVSTQSIFQSPTTLRPPHDKPYFLDHAWGGSYNSASLKSWSLSLNYKHIIIEKSESIGVITLNRPEVLNAMDQLLFRELDTAIGDMDTDPDINAVVFTGKGDRAFSAGADIHEIARLAERTDSPPPDPQRRYYAWNIATCRKPTIGALNGLSYGGGAVLASSFDIRVGCERSRFRFLAASYGRVNSTWSLPMQVGWPVAKELLFTARVIQAKEAYQIGLLNYLVPPNQLMNKALEIAAQIAENDPRMVQGIKELMIEDVGAGWLQMFQGEMDAQDGKLQPTPALEGFKEFLNRKGRK